MKPDQSRKMKIALALVFGLGLAFAGSVARSEDAPALLKSSAPNLQALHDAASPAYNGKCLSCHADVMKRPTLSAKKENAHAAMVPAVPGYKYKVGVTNENCVFCHSKTDFIQHSAAQIRKNVDPAICARCHGPTGKAESKFYLK